MTLSERIIEYRTREELSLAAFAAKAGVNRSTIYHAESGRSVSKSTAAKIERVLEEAADGEEE